MATWRERIASAQRGVEEAYEAQKIAATIPPHDQAVIDELNE